MATPLDTASPPTVSRDLSPALDALSTVHQRLFFLQNRVSAMTSSEIKTYVVLLCRLIERQKYMAWLPPTNNVDSLLEEALPFRRPSVTPDRAETAGPDGAAVTGHKRKRDAAAAAAQVPAVERSTKKQHSSSKLGAAAVRASAAASAARFKMMHPNSAAAAAAPPGAAVASSGPAAGPTGVPPVTTPKKTTSKKSPSKVVTQSDGTILQVGSRVTFLAGRNSTRDAGLLEGTVEKTMRKNVEVVARGGSWKIHKDLVTVISESDYQLLAAAGSGEALRIRQARDAQWASVVTAE
jgi:hypothetical protein